MAKKVRLTNLSYLELQDRFVMLNRSQSVKFDWDWYHANHAVIEAMRGIGVDVTQEEIKYILSLAVSQVLETVQHLIVPPTEEGDHETD